MQHLSWHTGIKSQFIANVVLDGARYYRSKVIPKRRGGERILFVPRPFLAGLQRWILDEALSKLKPHCSAFGFIKGRGIVENAKVHVNSKCIVKVDIKDFFGSVSYVTVYDIFLQAGYSPKISYFLSNICTLNDALPQGAPTSPALSNMAMFQADTQIAEFCSQNALLFTRYADDICLSGDLIPESAFPFLSDCLAKFGYEVAEDKTVLAFAGQKKIVTGISISSGKLKLPKEQRRKLRQAIHYISKHGINSHLANLAILDPIYRYRLAGQIDFWLSIEPDNEVAKLGRRIIRSTISAG